MPEENNDKNVYILGAGFSKELGVPLQDEFLLAAREVYFSNPSVYNNFERVFEYQDKLSKMKNYLSYPLLNLEHLFNLIEMDIFYSGSTNVKKIKDDFTKLICDVLVDKTPYPFDNDYRGQFRQNDIYDNYVSFVRLFIKSSRYGLSLYEDTIISFNYDLALEGAASIYNWRINEQQSPRQNPGSIKFNTSFNSDKIKVDQVSNFFKNSRQGSYFPPSDLYADDANSIKLIKLHGSINWKNSDDGKTFIVPPTWNKSDQRIKGLWNKAYQELKTAKRIIIIGYSFPDSDIYVKSLLALALNENKILQHIYFINPDKDSTKRACLSLLDKHFDKYCSYNEWKFSEFINGKEGFFFIKDALNRNING